MLSTCNTVRFARACRTVFALSFHCHIAIRPTEQVFEVPALSVHNLSHNTLANNASGVLHGGSSVLVLKAINYDSDLQHSRRANGAAGHVNEARRQTSTTASPASTLATTPRPTAPPFDRMDPMSTTLDFPQEPPVELAPAIGLPPGNRTLGGGMLTTDNATGLYVRRDYISPTGRDITLANSAGTYLFGTQGTYWSLHSHTHMYDAATGRRIALMTRPFWSLGTTWDVASYEPICETQEPQEERDEGEVLLYPFAKMTSPKFSYYHQWKLQRYNCDGSLSEVWQIVTRNYFSMKYAFDIMEPGIELPAGTIDQSTLFQMTAAYDAWISEGSDLTLFALTVMLIDMNIKASENSTSSNSHSSSGGGGGGGGGGGR